jgi:histidinol-phosphate phosphatase family protein
MTYDVVIPSAGRPSLRALLEAFASAGGPPPGRILVVFDGPASAELPAGIEALESHGRGPAAARNAGWRASHADWIGFLDDDVVPDRDWPSRLAEDLEAVGADVAGSQGVVRVPLPGDRRPTDWERNVAGLEHARWATADMAYRRSALAELGGFDERFPRAYREDADLALRALRAGYRLARGSRTVAHPPGPPRFTASVRAQAGNADDALMDALHGPTWRPSAGAPNGRLASHLATSGAGLTAVAAAATGRPRLAAVALAAWATQTASFAWERIAPGPRTPREIAELVLTSALIPPVAAYHRLAGGLRARRLARPALPAAVLLDRDGTLVDDVPYNSEPEHVVPVADARRALERLRSARIRLAVVSNQSGIARGLVTRQQVDAVNRRVEEFVGPIGPWLICPHGPDEGCECRKPSPGLIVQAARALGVEPEDCVLIGDIGSDVEAAEAPGARAILVPNGKTRPEEVAAASQVASSLDRAVDLVLSGSVR